MDFIRWCNGLQINQEIVIDMFSLSVLFFFVLRVVGNCLKVFKIPCVEITKSLNWFLELVAKSCVQFMEVSVFKVLLVFFDCKLMKYLTGMMGCPAVVYVNK